MSAVQKDEERALHTRVRWSCLIRVASLTGVTGHKSSIQTYLNYLIIVSPPFVPSAASNSATVRNFVARAANSTATDISKVTVFDPENKIVAFSGPFQEGVRDVLCAWGKIFVLSNDGKVKACAVRCCGRTDSSAVDQVGGEAHLGEA